MRFDNRTKNAINEAVEIIDWECDFYDSDTEEYEALREIIAMLESFITVEKRGGVWLIKSLKK